MQQMKRLIISVSALLYNAVLFAQEIFQVSLQIGNSIKSEIVSASFTCHSGKNDTPSIISSLSCSGPLHCNPYCKEPPVLSFTL